MRTDIRENKLTAYWSFNSTPPKSEGLSVNTQLTSRRHGAGEESGHPSSFKRNEPAGPADSRSLAQRPFAVRPGRGGGRSVLGNSVACELARGPWSVRAAGDPTESHRERKRYRRRCPRPPGRRPGSCVRASAPERPPRGAQRRRRTRWSGGGANGRDEPPLGTRPADAGASAPSAPRVPAPRDARPSRRRLPSQPPRVSLGTRGGRGAGRRRARCRRWQCWRRRRARTRQKPGAKREKDGRGGRGLRRCSQQARPPPPPAPRRSLAPPPGARRPITEPRT